MTEVKTIEEAFALGEGLAEIEQAIKELKLYKSPTIKEQVEKLETAVERIRKSVKAS